MATHGPLGVIPVSDLAPLRQISSWFLAKDAIRGVGDATLGEWRGGPGSGPDDKAVHIRRRLTAAEWGDRPWGTDYRGTPECRERIEKVIRETPYLPESYAVELLKECRG